MVGGREGGRVGEERPHDAMLPPPSEPHEPVQRELTALDREIEKQTVQLREWQMQELLTLRQQLHELEQETQQRHQQEVSSTTIAAAMSNSLDDRRLKSPPVCCRPSRS